MKTKPDLPRRRAMRLQDYDYSQPGVYYVTICVQNRQCIFGEIIDGKMQLNEIGQIVVECWNRIPQHFSSVEIGEFVIMPNHMHGIISWGIEETEFPHLCVGTRSPRPKNSTREHKEDDSSPSLGKITAYFKYQSTKHINQSHNMARTRIWQRNYHDHVVRDDKDLQRLHQYIQNNPLKWELDQLHPDNKGWGTHT